MRTGKVCASVSARTAAEAVTKILEAETAADVIEIRFDHLEESEVPRLLEHLKTHPSSKPLIATYRPKEQGGRASDSPVIRREFWELIGDDFWATDQEEDIFPSTANVTNQILSSHEFDSAPGDAKAVFERLRSKNATIIKYAYLAENITDTIKAWKVLEMAMNARQPAVVIAMGEAGKITRVLGPAYGSQWTYASLGNQTAPGQVSLDDLTRLYRVKELDRDTKVFGVIGDPVTRSLSPSIHNAAFTAAGINSVFLPLLVKDLRSFMGRMVRRADREVDLNFAGFAVTMPHKLSIIDHLDEIDETAEAIGAVNTVKIDGDLLHGYNTDAEGFIAPLRTKLGTLRSARVAILGAGGAARACLYALKKEGASTAVIARDPQKGEKLAMEFGAEPLRIGDEPIGTFDIMVNATPVGMTGFEGDVPFDLKGFDRLRLVYDLVTSAEPTPLIGNAQAGGLETISGVEMLIAQAVRQFEIWTGRSAPVDVMKKAAKTPVNQNER